MYYDEKVIDGILHCRGTPKGEWRPVSSDELNRKLIECKAQLAILRSSRKACEEYHKEYDI